VEFRTLGPLQVVDAGQALALGSGLQRAVLALLVVDAPEPVSVDRLIDELWGERPPASAQHAVQVYVSAIRKLLRTSGGEVSVRTTGSAYALETDPDRVDAKRFERLLAEAQQLAGEDPARARAIRGGARALARPAARGVRAVRVRAS
jgi:DNA-binding SARP family transcriptional activator